MSSGQKPRTPQHFPRMKDRAAGRRARKLQREAWEAILYDPDFLPRLGRTLEAWVEVVATIAAGVGRALEAALGLEFPRPLIARGPMRQAVIDAAQQPDERANPTQVGIDAIAERNRVVHTVLIAPAGTLPPDLGGNPAAWQPIGEISRELME
ncbi:hypothetical protein [Nocardia fluminea]|uniref:hypothetical protein n=1 Tax=Nocardia fluminea TaxID=134984 RepID=UPI00365F7154